MLLVQCCSPLHIPPPPLLLSLYHKQTLPLPSTTLASFALYPGRRQQFCGISLWPALEASAARKTSPLEPSTTSKVRDFAYSPACACSRNKAGKLRKCIWHIEFEEEAEEMKFQCPSTSGSQSDENVEKPVDQQSVTNALKGFKLPLPACIQEVVEEQTKAAGEPSRFQVSAEPGAELEAWSQIGFTGQKTPAKDFGYDDGWAQVFASKAPGNEVVEAPPDDDGDYPEQFALTPVGPPSQTRAARRHDFIARQTFLESDSGPPSPVVIEDERASVGSGIGDIGPRYDTVGKFFETLSTPPPCAGEPKVNPILAYNMQLAWADYYGFTTGIFQNAITHYRGGSPLSMLSDSSYDSVDSYGNDIVDIQLPIHGRIAQRRLLTRGMHLATVLATQVRNRNMAVQARYGRVYVDEPHDRADSDSDTSSYDSDGNKIFRIKLPVAGTIAQRRLLAHGEDLRCVGMIQKSGFAYEVGLRRGTYKPPEELFRAMDWSAGASKTVPEEVCPGPARRRGGAEWMQLVDGGAEYEAHGRPSHPPPVPPRPRRRPRLPPRRPLRPSVSQRMDADTVDATFDGMVEYL